MDDQEDAGGGRGWFRELYSCVGWFHLFMRKPSATRLRLRIEAGAACPQAADVNRMVQSPLGTTRSSSDPASYSRESSRHAIVSQTRTVLSRLAETTRLPSG